MCICIKPSSKNCKISMFTYNRKYSISLIISSLQQLHVPEPSQFVSGPVLNHIFKDSFCVCERNGPDKCDKKGRVETLWMVSLAYDLLVSCKQLELFFFENSDKYTTHVTNLFSVTRRSRSDVRQ